MIPSTSLVLELLSSKIGLPVEKIKLDDRLLHDLGLYGDDAEEFIQEVSKEFDIPLSAFDFGRHFFPESFAFWLLPPFLRRKVAASKLPMTVGDVISASKSQTWPRKPGLS